MSTIRCVNRKTGFVSIYEQIAYTDPTTNEVKYRRKYIGHENPLTGEVIASSGKRGRKKAEESFHYKSGIPYKDDYEQAMARIRNQQKSIDELTKRIAILEGKLSSAIECFDELITIVQAAKRSIQ
ncbi:MAG: hypothetical protein IJ865_08480 [Clostridia bacterium]|nr:hypothetical protein [Clostridia bacterium]